MSVIIGFYISTTTGRGPLKTVPIARTPTRGRGLLPPTEIYQAWKEYKKHLQHHTQHVSTLYEKFKTIRAELRIEKKQMQVTLLKGRAVNYGKDKLSAQRQTVTAFHTNNINYKGEI